MHSLLTAEQLAKELGLTERQVADATRSGTIPSVKFNSRTVRYHLPTVIIHRSSHPEITRQTFNEQRIHQ